MSDLSKLNLKVRKVLKGSTTSKAMENQTETAQTKCISKLLYVQLSILDQYLQHRLAAAVLKMSPSICLLNGTKTSPPQKHYKRENDKFLL